MAPWLPTTELPTTPPTLPRRNRSSGPARTDAKALPQCFERRAHALLERLREELAARLHRNGLLCEALSIRAALEHDALARVQQAVDDGLTDDGVFGESEPASGIDLRGDDDDAPLVAVLQQIDQSGRFLVGVRAKP